MAAKRTSVYLIDGTLKIAGNGDSLSGRLNQIVARYDDLIKESMPAFSKKEWCAIFDANNGAILSLDDGADMAHISTGVWANVADSQGFREKWGVDSTKLAGRLRDLEPAQKIAVIEAIQTFWEHHGEETDVALERATRGSDFKA